MELVARFRALRARRMPPATASGMCMVLSVRSATLAMKPCLIGLLVCLAPIAVCQRVRTLCLLTSRTGREQKPGEPPEVTILSSWLFKP